MKPPTRSKVWSIPTHHRTRTVGPWSAGLHHPYGDGSTPSHRYKLAQQLMLQIVPMEDMCHVTLIRFIKVQMLAKAIKVHNIAILAHWRPLSLPFRNFFKQQSRRLRSICNARATLQIMIKTCASENCVAHE